MNSINGAGSVSRKTVTRAQKTLSGEEYHQWLVPVLALLPAWSGAVGMQL